MKYDFDIPVERIGTNSVKYDLKKQFFGVDDDMIPMWVADMDFNSPPFVIEALKKRLEHKVLGYSFRNESYHLSIVNWLWKRHGWKIEKEWICFSPGIVPAFNLAVMAYTKPGDKIIVQRPVYFPFFSAIENHNCILVNNPLKFVNGKYQMDIEDLYNKIDKDVKMIFLCSPHNPTGNVWGKDVLEKLSEICLKNNILILSDEIHSDLIFNGSKHIPTASICKDTADITLTCVSPSKTFNLAGLSTSSVVIQNDLLRRKFEKVLDDVHVGGGNIFGFVASEAAYTYGEDWLGELMDYLGENLVFLIRFLENEIPGIKPVIPEATYMVWLDCRGLGLGPTELKDFFIKEAKIGLSDGTLFGPEGKGFQRINIGCSRITLEKALGNLKKAVVQRIGLK